jgi:hypothetical protein
MNLTPSQHAELADASRQQFGATLSPEQRLLVSELREHHQIERDRCIAARMRYGKIDATISEHYGRQAAIHTTIVVRLGELFPHG